MRNSTGTGVWVIFPCERMADSELRISATAQRRESIFPHFVVLGKVKLKIQSTFSIECLLLLDHGKVGKSLYPSTISQGPLYLTHEGKATLSFVKIA